MANITEKTGLPLLWTLGIGGGLLLAVVGGVGTIFAWRQEDRERLTQFETTTNGQLHGIERQIAGLGHRLDLFEQSIKSGTEDRFRKADMKLWLFKARLTYKDLPDIE